MGLESETLWFYRCDDCAETVDCQSSDWSETQELALNEGWYLGYRRDRDGTRALCLCPKCRRKKKWAKVMNDGK